MDIFDYALQMEKDGESFYREIAQKTVSSRPPEDKVVPQKNKFIGSKMTKRVSKGGYVSISSYKSAGRWDGRPLYQTSSGWGH